MGRRALVAIALLGGLSGCNWYYNTLPSPDDLVKLVPWFDHMIKSPVVAPYSRDDVPRRTPAGAIPVTGREVDWGTGDPTAAVPRYAFDSTFAVAFPNPTGRAVTARGDTLYQVFCALCHGVAGDGKSPVGPRLGAPSLLTDKAKNWPDGYLYSVVKYGRGNMPMYGDKIYRPLDRWAVVNYMRQLQGFIPGAAQ
ncbi:MAG: c-type cytochrome [Gemmatimonadetes bacterium]|nr:c-type cytochrome [Gemmatimonadota bacterium]